MLRWIGWLAIATAVACDDQHPHTAAVPLQQVTVAQPTTLPAALMQYAAVHFPQWQLVEKKDYSNTWWSFYDSSYNPCYARTDINDDQLADYALWLKKDQQAQLVIFTGQPGESFTHTLVYTTAITTANHQQGLTIGVDVAAPAQIDIAQPRIQSLVLKSNGFVLMDLEERTRIWHWQQGSLQTFYMK